MMAAYGVCFLLILLIAVPAALLIWCAATEAAVMKKRPGLSWLLPAGAMAAAAWSGRGLDGSSGVEALLWTLPALYGRCALTGTAGGATIGAILRWAGTPVKAKDETG